MCYTYAHASEILQASAVCCVPVAGLFDNKMPYHQEIRNGDCGPAMVNARSQLMAARQRWRHASNGKFFRSENLFILEKGAQSAQFVTLTAKVIRLGT